MTEKYKCCLCGKIKEGYGNNPWPLADPSEKCCDNCNRYKVVPARIAMAPRPLHSPQEAPNDNSGQPLAKGK